MPVVLLTFLLPLGPAASAQNRLGSITELVGSAQLARAGHTAAVTPAMAVELHDKLMTGPAAHLTVTLADNSRLALAESSTLVIDESVVGPGGAPTATKVSLFEGRLRSLVTAGLRGAVPSLQVQTPNAIAGVRGTDFEVAFVDGSQRQGFGGCGRFSDVGTFEGVVEVSNLGAGAKPIMVPAGYETTVPCFNVPLSPGPLGMTGTSLGGKGSAHSPTQPGSGAPPPSCPVCAIPLHR